MKPRITEEKKQRLRWLATLRWRLTLFVFTVLMISGLATAGIYALILWLFGFHPVVIYL